MARSKTLTPPVESLKPDWLTIDEWLRVVKKLSLAPRQAWIVALLLDGVDYPAMARVMGISESTVRTYLDRIKSRNDLPDRTALMVKVFKASR
jgi:DNA-binding NarL/FixJ family response regulator